MLKRLLSFESAMAFSVLALLSELWRGFLDAMFVFPVDFGDRGTMQIAAVVFTALFALWAWSLLAASRGGRGGLIAAFVLNALVLLAVPVGWLLFYCPAACRAGAGVFNLANTLNLLFGALAAVALGANLGRPPRPVVGEGAGIEATP